MIGVSHAFSTLRRLTRPLWATTDEQFLDVLVTPSCVQWEYIPYDTGKYRIFRCAYEGAEVFEAYETDDAGVMFHHFLRTCLPRFEQICIVLDDFGKVVFGWYHDGTETVWYGCAWAFGVLERVHDPADVALWEMNAKLHYDIDHDLRRMHRDH